MFTEVMMMILCGTREIMDCRQIGIQMFMEIVHTNTMIHGSIRPVL
jgi:hypothetical protein